MKKLTTLLASAAMLLLAATAACAIPNYLEHRGTHGPDNIRQPRTRTTFALSGVTMS